MLLERKRFVSFDGGTAEDAEYFRPDRYRMIDDSLEGPYRIVRGGGYSYAAASFGGGSIVENFTLFNRVLEFDSQSGLIKVEAGITLSDLLGVTVPRGFWLPVIPGYPAITVGGCIAANVHGLRDSVVDGKTGLLYTFGDIGELAGYMRQLLESPGRRNELRQGALHWAAGFDWEIAADETLNLMYKSIEKWNERKSRI